MRLPSVVRYLCLFLLSIIYYLLPKSEAFALEGVLVSPVIIEDTLDPGVSKSFQVKVTSGEKQDLYAFPVDFAPDPQEAGTPNFVFEDQQADLTYSVASWINISADPISFEADEKKVIPFSVTVPQEAEAGSHFGAVIFSTRSPDQEKGVALSGEVGSLVLVRVSGDVVEGGYLDSFRLDRAWYESPPVGFTTRFKNTGNVHLKPLGNIEIFSLFGRKIDNIAVNDQFGAVLPDSFRQFKNAWDPARGQLIPVIGRFKAELLLTYAAGQTASASVAFWVIPWRWILGVLGAIVVSAIVVRFVMRNFRIARRGSG